MSELIIRFRGVEARVLARCVALLGLGRFQKSTTSISMPAALSAAAVACGGLAVQSSLPEQAAPRALKTHSRFRNPDLSHE